MALRKWGASRCRKATFSRSGRALREHHADGNEPVAVLVDRDADRAQHVLRLHEVAIELGLEEARAVHHELGRDREPDRALFEMLQPRIYRREVGVVAGDPGRIER
jgi:hypothetical protein